MNWKLRHWLVVFGAPALQAGIDAFHKSGDLLTARALEHDAAAMVFAVVAIYLMPPKKDSGS